MKLSENTVKVLKNFATINSGIVVKPGNVLKTISPNKAVLAQAKIEEKFDLEFGIYDLNKTLALLSMTNGDEVEITKEYLGFKSLNGSGTIRQRFTPTNLILSPPNKEINIPSYDVSFKLSEETFKWIFSVASILKCPNIVFKSEGSGLYLWAMDVKGEIVDDASIMIDESCDENFQSTLKIENMKVVMGEYTVQISSKGVSKFLSKDGNLTYWIAVEQNSSKFE